jgi:hypothetical protein
MQWRQSDYLTNLTWPKDVLINVPSALKDNKTSSTCPLTLVTPPTARPISIDIKRGKREHAVYQKINGIDKTPATKITEICQKRMTGLQFTVQSFYFTPSLAIFSQCAPSGLIN